MYRFLEQCIKTFVDLQKNYHPCEFTTGVEKGVQILNCPWPPCATSPVSSVVSFRVSLFEQTLTAGTIVPSVKQLNHALNYGIDIVNQFLGILTVFQTVLKSKNL